MWTVYILYSLKDKKRYIGSTNDLERRINQHNHGLVQSTKSRVPLELLYSERFGNKSEARSREHFLKTHKGFNELEKILKNNGVSYTGSTLALGAR